MGLVPNYTVGNVINTKNLPAMSDRQAELENFRAALPANQYLYLLHVGAVSGVLPKLTVDGDVILDPDTGQPAGDKLTGAARAELAKELLRKTVPDLKPVAVSEAHTPTRIAQAEVISERDMTQMNVEELERLAYEPDIESNSVPDSDPDATPSIPTDALDACNSEL